MLLFIPRSLCALRRVAAKSEHHKFGAARSGIIIVGRHPNQNGVRVIASNKSNLGPTPKSLTFSLESTGDVARICLGTGVRLDRQRHHGTPGQEQVSR